MNNPQRTVLIITRGEDDLAIIHRALSQEPSVAYHIVAVASGAEALAYLRGQQPDCLFLADQVADGAGLALLQQVKQQAAPHIYPIIFVADATNHGLAQAALQQGAHDFLLKTELTPHALLRAIHHALEKVALLRQLEEQRALNHLLLESSPDCVKVLDGAGRLLSMNSHGLHLMEIDDFTQLAGQPWTTLWPAESEVLIQTALADARACQQGHFQAFCPTAKGTPKWWDVIVMAVKNGQGIPSYFIAASRDITERKETAEALRRSEERYRNLFEMMDEGFCVLEMIYDAANQPVDYRFLEVNPAFTRFTGLVDAVGKTARELVPNLEAHWIEIYGAVARTGEARRFIEGSTAMARWFNVYAFRLGGPESQRVALLFNNITEQKRTEEALRASEEQLRQITDNLPALISVVNDRGEYELVNRNYQRWLGLDPSQLIGQPVSLVVAQSTAYQVAKPNLQRALAGETVTFENQLRTPHGTALDILTTYMPRRAADGRVTGCFVLAMDISERKQMEEAIRSSEERLRLALEAAQMGAWEWHPQTDQAIWSAENFRIFGLEPDASGRGPAQAALLQLLHVDDRSRYRTAIAHLVQGAPYLAEQLRILRPDGSLRWIACHAQMAPVESGQIVRVIGVTQDITEQKRHETEQRFLADLGEVMMGVQDPNELLACAAQRLGEFLGVSRSFFTELDRVQAQMLVHRNYHHPSLSSLAGIYPLADFDPHHLATHEAGRVVVLTDIPPAAVVATGDPDRYTPLQMRAMVSTPLMRNGLWVAALVISDHNPRPWTDAEIGIIQIVAERAWLAVENRRLLQETKTLLAQVQAGQQLLQTITDNIPGLISYVDSDQRYHFTNATYGAWHQCTLASILGRTMAEVKGPTIYAKLQPYIARALQGELVRFEETLSYPDTTRTVWATYVPNVDEQGVVRGIYSLTTDISDRKAAEEALRQSEETARQRLVELEAIYDTAPIGLCVLDRELRWVRINERLAEINGFPVQAHIGRSIRELLPQLAPVAEPVLRTILESDQPLLNFDLQGETPAQPGVERIWREHWFPLHDSDGTVIGINIVAEEITERKRQERELKELNATLEQRVIDRTQQLAQKNQELEHTNRELDKFAYIASHDLKSPLRAIDNLSQWISEDLGARLPEPSKTHLLKLQGRVRRMEKLLDDLLIYSRVGRFQYNVELIELKSLLQDLIALLIPSADFQITLGESLPSFLAQRVPLETVLRNLLDNAIKHHNRPDGRVHIAAYDQGEWIEFVLSDDGPGIDPQFHGKIFEVFQTLQPRDKVEGSGIGLAIVKKSIENQGGAITIQSQAGAGATFRFTWPKGARKGGEGR